MIRYVIKRFLLLIPILLAVSFIVYFIIDLTPGDAVDAHYSELSTEEKDEMREKMGLNDPVIIRYGRYIWGALHGDMGESTTYHEDAIKVYFARLPATLELAFWGILVAMLIAIPFGILAARKQNSLIDNASMLFGLFGLSIPNFWLGLMLIIMFSLNLKLLPSNGNESWTSIILPAITIGTSQAALLIRTTRSSMLEVIRQDYLNTARGKGVRERSVIYQHALSNALIPIITAVGSQFTASLGGAVITESVFAWPGVGRLIIDSINTRDEVMVVSAIMLTTMFSSIVIVVVDILYAFVDPRIKARYSGKSNAFAKKGR